MYNTGAQVLGVLIERAAGMPLEEFMRERLFNPLGMVDTGFSMRPDQAGRFTTAYAPDPTTGAPVLLDPADGGWWSRPPAMPNCAGGLLSTVDDLWRFAELLLQGGSYDGRRVLSPESVAAMTQDHLTPRSGPTTRCSSERSRAGATPWPCPRPTSTRRRRDRPTSCPVATDGTVAPGPRGGPTSLAASPASCSRNGR